VTLADEEIEQIDTGNDDDTKQFFNSTGFLLEQHDDSISLKRKHDNQEIEISFALPTDEYEGPEQAETDPENTEENQESGDDGMMKSVHLDVTIRAQGAPEGESIFLAECAIGKDRNVYLENMRIGGENERRLWLADLSETMQEKLYAYLEEVGLDSTTAGFISDYIDNFKGKAAVNSLQKLKGFLSGGGAKRRLGGGGQQKKK